MRAKKRSAKKLQFSNRSQGKKSQERNCDSPIRVKKKCEENFRCSNPYRARNSSNKDDASQTKSGMRERERQRQRQREAKQARERESSKTWKAKHIPSAIPSLSQCKEEEEEEQSVCWEKSVRY
jgi:hypothetical protein